MPPAMSPPTVPDAASFDDAVMVEKQDVPHVGEVDMAEDSPNVPAIEKPAEAPAASTDASSVKTSSTSKSKPVPSWPPTGTSPNSVTNVVLEFLEPLADDASEIVQKAVEEASSVVNPKAVAKKSKETKESVEAPSKRQQQQPAVEKGWQPANTGVSLRFSSSAPRTAATSAPKTAPAASVATPGVPVDFLESVAPEFFQVKPQETTPTPATEETAPSAFTEDAVLEMEVSPNQASQEEGAPVKPDASQEPVYTTGAPSSPGSVLFDLFDPNPSVSPQEARLMQTSMESMVIPTLPTAVSEETAEEPLNLQPIKPLHCIYETNCPALFTAIENGEWGAIVEFLDTNEWPGLQFFPDFAPQDQARSVVTHAAPNGGILWSRLPLHQAIICGAPFEVTVRLIMAYPASLHVTDHLGNLPAHLALRQAYGNEDFIAFLMKRDPQAFQQCNRAGLTPVETALQSTRNLCMARARVLKILEHYSRGTKTPTKVPEQLQNLPTCDYDEACPRLYKKLQSRSWQSVMTFMDTGVWQPDNFMEMLDSLQKMVSGEEYIVQGNPQLEAGTVVQRKYSKENVDRRWHRLPLHLAILCDAPLGVIQRLVAAFPAATAFPDNQGMLPVHLAFYYNAPDTICAHLMQVYPESVNTLGMQGQLTVIQAALEGPRNQERGKMLKLFVRNKFAREAAMKQKQLQEEQKAQPVHGGKFSSAASVSSYMTDNMSVASSVQRRIVDVRP